MNQDFVDRLNIKLENFQFYHRPSSSGKVDPKYIQRNKPAYQLTEWLKNANRHGTYLVAGYRGVGKSSLVGSVIHNLKKEYRKNGKRHYIDICVNIGQENINEADILQIIAKNLRDTFMRETHGHGWIYEFFYRINNSGYHIALLSLFSLFLNFFGLSITQDSPSPKPSYLNWIAGCLLAISASMCLIWIFQKFLRWLKPLYKAIDRLERLCERFNSKTTYKVSASSGTEQFRFGAIAKEREIQPANIQEIEYDLIRILRETKKYHVIIVLDELDKADPEQADKRTETSAPDYEKVSIRPEHHTTSRNRRKQVLRVIGNMKFFLSTADAYFIFIAGRELYEASMADLSDRDFSISNIFNGIINIDSFYLHPDTKISDSIAFTEDFVCRQILPKQYSEGLPPRQCLTLHQYREYRNSQEKREKNPEAVNREVIFLYHFVCYLAFISNGSPKKIMTFFEQYIRTFDYLEKNNLKPLPDNKQDNNTYYLSFSAQNQLKINFVHHISYPVLQHIMSRSGIFGDKLQVSYSFILAHIFKLHNCGFSWRNLEHTPEILEINRSPEIREYIGTILNYMSRTHLTSISCGLYHYKFPMRLAEEISYFSKLSNEFSALFNFSLDELQPVKEHYFHILDHNRPKPETLSASERQADIYAEASIRHSLGDIYMQEENYASAIRQFEKCIELTSPLLYLHEPQGTQIHNYLIFYNRTMLKLGLAHEKRHTDNSAFAVYRDLIQTLLEINRKQPCVTEVFQNNRTMHLGILAQLYVLEKLDTTGIQDSHINDAIATFKHLCDRRPFYAASTDNRIIKSDFYRKLGDILYYRNMPTENDENLNTQSSASRHSAQHFYALGIVTLLGIGTENIEEQIHSIIQKPEKIDKRKHYNLAILFESYGHTCLRKKEDTSQHDNLESIRDIITCDTAESSHNFPKHSPCLRAILYYWAASKFYIAASEQESAGRCYGQILYVLGYYVRGEIVTVEPEAYNYIKEIADFVTRRRLMSLYNQYGHINFAETSRIGKMLHVSEPQLIGRHLSLYPDIDELSSTYYSFVISCCQSLGKTTNSECQKLQQSLAEYLCYTTQPNTIPNSTLSSTVLRYRTILYAYRHYLNILLFDEILYSLQDLKPDIILTFMESTDPIPDYIQKGMSSFIETGDSTNKKYRLKLIHAILTQAIKHSKWILKMIEPLQGDTLFNYTFRGNIYFDFAIFRILYNQLCHLYGYSSVQPKLYLSTPELIEFHQQLVADHEAELQEPIRYTDVNYLVENAIHAFTKAFQCSHQGAGYQELIRSINFLEDDLNNNTIQFYLATERLVQNRTQEKNHKLKKHHEFNHGPYYLIDTYWPQKENATDASIHIGS